MSRIDKLHQLGQSLWYDNIQRKLLENGDLARMIEAGDIRGVTSNPSIFHNAIAKSTDYDAALLPMAWSGWSAEQIFNQLAIEDIQAAADLFAPLYKKTGGKDGYVSLEVSPLLANDTEGTVREARTLWKAVNRPNLMIKVPATKAGIPAVRTLIADGINVNVTLIFSLERYAEVMFAYMEGLERRAVDGKPIDKIASVASFFISRVDGKVDARLEALIKAGGPQAEKAKTLLGKAAIANAKQAYKAFMDFISSERFTHLYAKGAKVQRPLWASTSTKNAAYRDVIYIEELIGSDTVNTVPPQTLDAFRDHGEARLSLEEGQKQAWQVLQDLETLDISMKAVTDQLEAEGVKAFEDAFKALMETLEERRVAAQKQLGKLAKPVADRVHKLAAASAGKRLAERDVKLWSQNEAGEAEIARRLGWLDAPAKGLEVAAEYEAFAAECVEAGFTHAVLLGMGGSSLAPEVMRLTFGKAEKALDLIILDSTDPGQVREAARWSPVDKTLYIVSSKSGGTAEVNAFLDFFWARARRRLGVKAGSHFIAITDPNTSLEKMATERKFRRVFLADPTVGGRFSALTAFGLVPAALMGVDVKKMLERAAWMASQCDASAPEARNPGLVLGAVMGEGALRGRDKVTFLADPEVSSIGAWLEQLIAESSGKLGKGIVPVDGEPKMTARTCGQDRIVAYLKVSGAEEDKAQKLRKGGVPVLTLSFRDVYDLAAEFFRWEVATAIACAILEVNAFDQPDVQDNKDRTLRKVKSFQETRAFDEGHAVWEGAGGRVYGWDFPGLNSCKTLADVVGKFVEQVKPGDYLAMNCYLPRNAKTLRAIQRVRKSVQGKNAVTLGFGPRFLHSTGQLHKGGANNGVFLQITADPEKDVEIPGQGITFGTLERAQALGDLEALLARGRRAIRVHLVDAKITDLIVTK